MSSQFCIGGNILKRFVQSSTLLYLVDPVPGEPTTHSLDRHPDDTESPDRQCGKFLDSIALICATHKIGDSVSAATLEEGAPQGTIIRVACNAGFSDETLGQIEDIVTVLNRIADEGPPEDVQTDLLARIVRLDAEKIRHYLGQMQKYSQEAQKFCNWITEHPEHFDHAPQFRQWITKLPLLAQQTVASQPHQLLNHIQWAADARWVYGRFIGCALEAQGQGRQIPPWIMNVYKLGRYSIASNVLVRFAIENRGLFCPMRVEALEVSGKQRFVPDPDEDHLEAALRRSIGADNEELTLRLARHWGATDPPSNYFRSKLPRQLAVHAEMQLLNFYEANPDKMPRRRFIGVSKKSCFLCHKFLENHPLNFAVSACHQKLYLSWCIPPCTSTKIYNKYKDRIGHLSSILELAVRHEIEQRLAAGPRRTFPLDSTAGVSRWTRAATRTLNAHDHDEVDSMAGSVGSVSDEGAWQQIDTMINSSTPDLNRLTIADVNTPSLNMSEGAAVAETGMPDSKTMTFHVKRADNPMRQDVVAITDIIDAVSGKPRWDRLCEILATEPRLGVGFDELNEFIMINQTLRVGSARQFNACLEYLRNDGSWNNEALVHKYTEVPRL